MERHAFVTLGGLVVMGCNSVALVALDSNDLCSPVRSAAHMLNYRGAPRFLAAMSLARKMASQCARILAREQRGETHAVGVRAV